MEIEVLDATIRATDRANEVVEIETVGWDQPAPELGFPFAVDATIAGRATRLSMDTPNVTVGSTGPDGRIGNRIQLGANESVEFDDDEDRGAAVFVTGRTNTWIRFEGPGTVEKRDDRDLVITFPHPTAVTVGFQGSSEVPGHTVTVPETPEGVATALSHFAATYTDTGPARTSTITRGHPPEIAFGDELDVPDRIRNAGGVEGVELHLPPTLETLLPAASLATYLGADVSVGSETPRLSIPGQGVEREFAGGTAFQFDAAATVRRVFFLDMLVRWLDESDLDWMEADVLPVLDLDVDRCAGLSLPERVREYLSVDFERVASVFPEWTANVYAAPTYDSVLALPYLVRHLAQVYLPGAYPPDHDDAPAGATWARDRVESLHDVAGVGPGGDGGPRGPRVRPRGPYVGWLGGDPPDDPFQVTLSALRHREKYLGDHDEPSVAIVCGDADRSDDLERLRSTYDVETPPVAVTVYDRPAREELVDCVAGGLDLFHYLGPCEDGLACADGTLDPGDLPASNARNFFLDGANARETGLAMLSAGSVAGVAWSGPLGAGAETVRENFLDLYLGGMTVDFAARYARHFADPSAPLAVLGDPFQELVRFGELDVFPMEIEPVGDGQFRVVIPCWYQDTGSAFGGLCLDRWHFGGNQFDLTLSASEVTQLLETIRYGVVYDGEIYRFEEVTPFDPAI